MLLDKTSLRGYSAYIFSYSVYDHRYVSLKMNFNAPHSFAFYIFMVILITPGYFSFFGISISHWKDKDVVTSPQEGVEQIQVVASGPRLVEELEPETNPVSVVSESIDLISDLRLYFDQSFDLDIAELISKSGNNSNIEIVYLDDENQSMSQLIRVSVDEGLAHIQPTREMIGRHQVALITNGDLGAFEEKFSIFINPRHFSDINPEILDTVLLDLPASRIQLSGINRHIWLNRGAMGISGNRVLINDSADQFFMLDLSDDNVSLEKLPIKLNINRSQFLKNFEDGNYFGLAIMAIHDLIIPEPTVIIASYSYWNIEQQCMTLRVSRLEVSEDWSTVISPVWQNIFESSPCLPINADYQNFAGHQVGGRMLQHSQNSILLTIGELGKDIYPQNPDADYGKVYEIKFNGEKELISLGHRNVQGLLKDNNGNIWITEHGPRGGDELNFIKRNTDYGWPTVSLGVNYNEKTFNNHPVVGLHDDFEEPRYAWVPSIGISNIIQVSNFRPEWEGDFLINSLVGKQLRRLRLSPANYIVYDEPIYLGARLRDSGQLADGRIIIYTDNGQMIVLHVDPPNNGVRQLTSVGPSLGEGARAALSSCLECHIETSGVRDSAVKINLANIFGRKIGGSSEYNYTTAFKSFDDNWGVENLDEFLKDPQKFAPGTSMSFQGIQNGRVRGELVQYLQMKYSQ